MAKSLSAAAEEESAGKLFDACSKHFEGDINRMASEEGQETIAKLKAVFAACRK